MRKPVTPTPGTAMANRWRYVVLKCVLVVRGSLVTTHRECRYYQYLNLNMKEVPRMAAPHFLTYDEEEDGDAHYGGGENILVPVGKKV